MHFRSLIQNLNIVFYIIFRCIRHVSYVRVSKSDIFSWFWNFIIIIFSVRTVHKINCIALPRVLMQYMYRMFIDVWPTIIYYYMRYNNLCEFCYRNIVLVHFIAMCVVWKNHTIPKNKCVCVWERDNNKNQANITTQQNVIYRWETIIIMCVCMHCFFENCFVSFENCHKSVYHTYKTYVCVLIS